MLELFRQYVEEQNLILPGEKVLVAVSGGVDSMVLLDLLSRSGQSVAIAHCNFGLRGQESEKDESLVKEIGSQLGIDTYTKSFETQEYASKEGISIQMAARDLRYEWFGELMQKDGFDKLATAHHKNDQFETALYNLTKGTGLKGLIPLSSSAQKTIVRPLMFVSRDQIEDYAEERGLQWREDASNANTEYHRNRLRLNVIPELMEINPALLDTSENTFERLKEANQVLSEYIQRFKESFVIERNKEILIPVEDLSKSLAPSTILYEILQPLGFNYVQCLEIASNLNSQSGSQFYSESHKVLIDREVLRIYQGANSNEFEIIVEDGIHEVRVPFGRLIIEIDNEISISRDSKIGIVDADKVKFPLTIRSFKEGDRFHPLGMRNSKKVSDFFIDEKVPLNKKSVIPIVFSDKEIVWIAGHRIDNRYKVTESTNKIIRLKYEEDES